MDGSLTFRIRPAALLPSRKQGMIYQAGLPSLKRSVRVSPPFTTSRASVKSAPSCFTLEPVISICSCGLNSIPTSSSNFLGRKSVVKKFLGAKKNLNGVGAVLQCQVGEGLAA